MKLKENEKIIKVLKNHYFTNFILWFLVVVFILILWGVYYFFSDFKYIFVILVVLVQIFLVFFYYLFLNFELWIIVITDKRVISVKKLNIFQNKYIDLDLKEIHEIKAKQKWMFANYFWFWSLLIFFKSWESIDLKYTSNVLNEAKELLEIIKKTK